MSSPSETNTANSSWRTGVIAGALVAAAIKVYLGASLGLFQDEAFYFMESQRLAPSYSDIPPLTAYAIRAGTELFGTNVLGVRAGFLLAGVPTPFLLYWLAKPIVGRREAWQVAGCGLLLPLMVAVGPIAVADSLLIPASLVFIGALERATRTSAMKYWWLTGAAMALGFLAHYRFGPVALGGAVYLLASANGRRLLRTPGPWLAALMAILGLWPVLWYSFTQEHQALQFQLVERHPWTFDVGRLAFVADQALVTTPLLFGFLVAAWIRLGRDARHGDDRRFFIWQIATFASGLYFVLSPFMDQHFDVFHWPLVGYLVLMVAVPELLRSVRRGFAVFTVALSLVLTVAAAGILSLQAHTDFLYRNAPGLLFKQNTNFAGWRPMAERAEYWLDKYREENLLLVGDHYVTAAQLWFYLGREAYTTEPWKLRNDGRAPQLRMWNLDQAGLAKQSGRDALVVYLASERGRYTADRHRAALDRYCRMFESVEHLDRLILWGGNKMFDYYLGRNIRGGPAESCPVARGPSAREGARKTTARR